MQLLKSKGVAINLRNEIEVAGQNRLYNQRKCDMIAS